MISIMGAIVAMLSITGILIWARKRKSRVQSRMPSREQQLRKIAQ